MTTLEKNKVIATFMGAREDDFDEWGIGWSFPQKEWYMPRQAPNADELRYHDSWDWLMPVVEKIEGMDLSVSITPTEIEIRDHKGIYKECIQVDRWRRSASTRKLEAVYRSVYVFLRWYNRRKK